MNDTLELDLYDAPYKLIDMWIQRGDGQYLDKENDKDKELFRFIYYWIAFNQMYNFVSDFDEDKSETLRIKQFCDRYGRIIFDSLDFDADYMKIFKERPIVKWFDMPGIYDWRQGEKGVEEFVRNRFKGRSNSRDFDKYCKDTAKNYVGICNPRGSNSERAEALMLSIYRVRCNLFHGSKDPDRERNGRLIHSAAQILEIILPALKEEIFRRR